MLTLTDIIERAEKLYAANSAVILSGSALTYGELFRRSRRLAEALLASGIKPGERIAILSRNDFRYLEINYACALAGIVLVPLNIRLSPAEIEDILARTQARFLFRSMPARHQIAEAVWQSADQPFHSNSYEAFLSSSMAQPISFKGGTRNIAQIYFTSGTTGKPKGVCLTIGNFVASALDSVIAFELKAEDIWFHAAPMFHLVDASLIWAMPIVGGAHIAEHFDPETFRQIVDTRGVTKLALPPTLLDMIARRQDGGSYSLNTLDRIAYGGSPMPAAVLERCRTVFPCKLVQSYGTTETSGAICQQTAEEVSLLDGSAGQPPPHVLVRVAGLDGATLPPGEIGEICVTGPRVMSGYWSDPEATSSAIVDGWYRTGDLGIEGPGGRIRIVGRHKEMIITGGENVYPAEVEGALLRHPAVSEAAVFGIDDEHWGERVVAVVFVADTVVVTSRELEEHCRSLLGGFKVPRFIEIRHEPLPKSGPGKIVKHELKVQFAAPSRSKFRW